MPTEDGDDLAGLIPERVDSNTPAPCHAENTICHEHKFEIHPLLVISANKSGTILLKIHS